MKKRLQNLAGLFVLIFSATFLLSSCEGPEGPMGEPGYGTYWKVIPFTVNQADWLWDSKLECYYYDFNVPEITRTIADQGLVDAAVQLDGNYVKLQNTEYFYATYYDNEGKGMYISESLNFEYRTGYIRFTVKALDLYDTTPDTYLPNTYKYKVTLVWER